ncbi:acyltransferase domain-containing protein [Gryllotalpicola koreensis]|uniref:GNAT-like C-terminal domain-containing protein n=1 Tax=Gryllotalpicola koreensis TaxID=993086 RepID=A0ABP8A548_9MICO
MSLLTTRLEAATTDRALAALGFRRDDRPDAKAAIAAALADRERLAEVEVLAERVRATIGAIGERVAPFDHPLAASNWGGIGVLPLLALLAVADDVRAFHRSRGIPAFVSDRSLSDLGQQVWVHRRTYGAFGLHTYGWLAAAFCGNLYSLGRLQFNLLRRADEWMLSTHIPETGPLTPESVDDSFAQAAAFFGEHFPDYPATAFHCESWLLDPQLARALAPASNIVRFQQRWRLEEKVGPADGDALFFVFRRRGDVDLSTLPRTTSLQRAVVEKLESGGHWGLWSGTCTAT